MDKDDNCLSPIKLFERLVKLETTVCVTEKKDHESLVLARQIDDRDKAIEKERLDHRFEVAMMKISFLEKMVYLGMGALLAVQIIVHYWGGGK